MNGDIDFLLQKYEEGLEITNKLFENTPTFENLSELAKTLRDPNFLQSVNRATFTLRLFAYLGHIYGSIKIVPINLDDLLVFLKYSPHEGIISAMRKYGIFFRLKYYSLIERIYILGLPVFKEEFTDDEIIEFVKGKTVDDVAKEAAKSHVIEIDSLKATSVKKLREGEELFYNTKDSVSLTDLEEHNPNDVFRYVHRTGKIIGFTSGEYKYLVEGGKNPWTNEGVPVWAIKGMCSKFSVMMHTCGSHKELLENLVNPPKDYIVPTNSTSTCRFNEFTRISRLSQTDHVVPVVNSEEILSNMRAGDESTMSDRSVSELMDLITGNTSDEMSELLSRGPAYPNVRGLFRMLSSGTYPVNGQFAERDTRRASNMTLRDVPSGIDPPRLISAGRPSASVIEPFAMRDVRHQTHQALQTIPLGPDVSLSHQYVPGTTIPLGPPQQYFSIFPEIDPDGVAGITGQNRDGPNEEEEFDEESDEERCGHCGECDGCGFCNGDCPECEDSQICGNNYEESLSLD